jgi:hypothetical protein
MFEAGTFSGSFATVALPTLGSGLSWDTSSLSSGIIRVLSVASTFAGWSAGYAFAPGTEAMTFDADSDGN